jgi:hypothetical protein
MRYATPDAAAAAYFAALEAVTALPAQRWSETVAVCTHCGGPESRRLSSDRETWYAICADCGQPWAADELEVGLMRAAVRIRGRIGWEQGGGRLVRANAGVRPDVAEWSLARRLDVLRPLRALFERRPRDRTREEWEFDLAVWALYLHPGVGCSYVVAARVVQEVTRDPTLTRGKIERMIERARDEIAERMKAKPRRGPDRRTSHKRQPEAPRESEVWAAGFWKGRAA